MHEQGDMKRAMIHAALELFQEKGYPLVSVQDIVNVMGVTKGAFYYYFQSKEELLFMIHDEFIEYELAAAEATLREDLAPATKLARMIKELLESVSKFQSHVKVFFRDWHYLNEQDKAQIKSKRDRYERMFYEVIVQGKESGAFRQDVDPRIATFAVFGMCNWMYQWYKPTARLTVDEIARMMQTIFLHGYESADIPVAPALDAVEGP
ncbi:MAG TPA: TetR/AcrR family transcriptional regulator [Symbiobacteriaceae bacterium]|nr:TetR/AcrR family transcriptional regulator [Symbiobacteriaceae bacterium]